MTEGKVLEAEDILLPLPYSSYGEYCLESLKKGCHGIAFVDSESGEECKYNELAQKSVNVAACLRKMGLNKGDSVAIVSENRVEFAVTAFATWYIGGMFTAVGNLCTVDEIKHYFLMTRPSTIFVTPSKVREVLDAIKKLSLVSQIIVFDQGYVGFACYKSLEMGNESVDDFKVTPVGRDDIMLTLYSSGTTGLPKGVMMSNRTLLRYPVVLRYQFTAVFNDPNACLLGILPYSHTMGFNVLLCLTTMNVKTVLIKQFQQHKFLKILEKHKVTFAFLVPPLLVYLAKHPQVLRRDLSSLKHICSGGAKAPQSAIDGIYERLNIKVRELYGSTETGATLNNPELGLRKVNSIGKILPGMQAKVCDPKTNAILGPNNVGELRFMGPMIMSGYVGPKEIINEAFDANGFYRSGDMGYYDEDGYFFLVDRLKELIKYNGYQVAPVEIENVIMEHRDVKAVGVVGLPDPIAGELPVAFVERVPGGTVSAAEITELVASKVAPYKKLRGGVYFIETVPKNKSGKVLRRELKEILQKMKSSRL